MKAVVVDADYGSVTTQELKKVQEAYEKAGIKLELQCYNTEQEIIEGCQGAVAILATGNPPITRRVMEGLPDLQFVQRFGIGVNSVDLEAADELGKIVLYLPGFCAKELADLATAMIMTLIRNVAYYDREIRKGNWPKCQYFLPMDVRKLTLGLYGFGASARYLHDIFRGGFGTRIISCDPYVTKEVKEQYPHVEFVSFDELLEQSDIISIHVGLTPETTHVFNRESFRKMKESAMIINTARGAVVDEKALEQALKDGWIRYAGLDTFEEEPIEKASPLLELENVILNPHSGSYGTGSKETQIQLVCTLIPAAVSGKEIPIRNVANKKVIEKAAGYKFS